MVLTPITRVTGLVLKQECSVRELPARRRAPEASTLLPHLYFQTSVILYIRKERCSDSLHQSSRHSSTQVIYPLIQSLVTSAGYILCCPKEKSILFFSHMKGKADLGTCFGEDDCTLTGGNEMLFCSLGE